MDNQNLNIFLKFLEKSGSDMNNINSFLNNLQNNDIVKFKNIFVGKVLSHCTFTKTSIPSSTYNGFHLIGSDDNVAKNNYDFITLKDNDYDKPFILIVEDKKIIDLLSFTEFNKHFIHFPNTLKFILSDDIHKLIISYYKDGYENTHNHIDYKLKNFIVVDFKKITIDFLDLSNICNKYIKL